MALPDWDRCHSCFSIFTSPAATPSSIVADVTASQTPESCGPAAAEPAFAVAGWRAAHPAAHPRDAIARANLANPKPANRIRTNNLPALTTSILHDQTRFRPASRNSEDRDA